MPFLRARPGRPLRTRRHLPGIGRFARFIASRTPGDRLIAWILLAALALAAVAGALSALRSFQVIVPAYGGLLDEGVLGRPRFPNPLIAATDADRDIVALTYAGLMGYGADGSLVPVLAESYSRSDDGLRYTFTLRPNARFSDGAPVGADSVALTVNLVQDPDLKSPLRSAWEGVTVEAIDARTVQFTLSQPYAPFLEQATLGILPAHLWRDTRGAELPFSPYTTEPVGAGPFSLDRIVRSRDGKVVEYRFTAFDEYALGRPFLDRVHLTFFDDQSTLSAALEAGRVTSAHGVSRAEARSAPYARIFGVFFNPTETPALADVAVRRALAYAIDRNGITTSIFGGSAAPIDGPLPPPASSREAVGYPRLEEARQILSDAGWAQDPETQRWTKDGEELRVSLVTATVPELSLVAERIQADWGALGIPTELILSSPSDLVQSVIRPRAFSTLLFGEVVGSPADLYPFWASTERSDPGLNISLFGDPTTDALLAQLRAGTASDPDKATTDVEARISAAYPAAFLYTPSFLYRLPRDVGGVTLGPIKVPSDRFRGIHAWFRETHAVWPAFAPATRQ